MFNKSAKTKIIFGILTLVILSSSIYFLMPDKAKILIEDTRTKYYVYENEFVLSATEYVNIYDGTKKMRASSREVTYWNDSKYVYAQRISKWKDDIATIQTYTFSQESGDIEQFPIKNEFQCLNCQGKIVHYEIRDIKYDGETNQINNPFSFGHNMKIEWQDGAYYSKVFQQKSSDKIIIKYRPQDDDETYNVRLFDPPVDSKTKSDKHNVTFEFSKLGIIDKCLDISIQNLQDTSDNLDLKTILNETNFDINAVDLIFQEWKSEEILVNDTETICIFYNETTINGTIEHQNCTTNIIGNHTKEVWSWETKSLTKSDKEGKPELKNTWEQVAIQKAGNKDTKNFRLCFSTPIIQTSSGWGNKGTFYLDLNGEIFWDKTHSSWFDSTFDKRRDIGNLTGNFSYINIIYDSDMQADFDDLRFTNTAGTTEFNYTISDKVDSSWVTVRINNQGDNSIYMYYGNADVSTTSNASDTYFNPYLMYYFDEISGNATDVISSNDGIINGSTQGVVGYINNSYSLDGVDDSVTSESNLGLTGSPDLTAIIRFKTSSSVTQSILAIGTGSLGTFVIQLENSGSDIRLAIEGGNRIFNTATAWNDGQWHQVAARFNGTTAAHIDMFMDYDKLTQKSVNAQTLNIQDATLKVGCGFAYTAFANGSLDEVIIYNTNISNERIFALVNHTSPSYTLGAEESGNTAPTLTANATKPDTVYTNTNWLINLTATDPEESYINAWTQFYVDNVATGSQYFFNLTNNTNQQVATLGSGNFSKDEVLIANIILGDGIVNNSAVNLSSETVQDANITGTLKDADGNVLNGTVFIVNQTDNSYCGNVSALNGNWTFGPVISGHNYTIVGYKSDNVSLDGDAEPHVEVPA